MDENKPKANFVAKILFVLGGIILFILLAVFILRLVPVAVSNIANLGSSIGSSITKAVKGDQILVTTNTDSVPALTPVMVNFEYTPEIPGQYFVSYACNDGLFYDIQSNNGPKRIICNTPFRLGENLTAISLVPVVTKANVFIDSQITIEYKDEQSNTIAKGSTVITVKNEGSGAQTATSTASNPFDANGSSSGAKVNATPVTAKPVTPATSSGTGTSKPATTASKPYVPSTRDLTVTHIEKLGNQSAFVFYVYNMGNTPTGSWEFTYTDAEDPSKTLVSPLQASLGAGQGLAVTVQFSGQKNSNQSISVNVDPYNRISESNESNNYSSVTITGNRSSGSGSGSYDSSDDADLVITDMEVGRMSGSRFTEDDQIDEDDTAAVRFVVKNQGGESTGSWRFEITNLPYDSGDTYRSKSYASLKPGESLEIVAEFDGIDEGRYTVRVEVDSEDDVDEERENNNTASETLRVDN